MTYESKIIESFLKKKKFVEYFVHLMLFGLIFLLFGLFFYVIWTNFCCYCSKLVDATFENYNK